MAKGGLARQRFEEKRRRNEIVRQLNALKSAGFTDDDIRGAGKNAWQELGGPDLVSKGNGQYVVADGDTLSTIAKANGVTETDILQQNPDVKKIQTGMVLTTPGTPVWRDKNISGNLPRLGSSGWLDQNRQSYPGGVGLPSNAALGGTTPNPQGSNYFQSEKQSGIYTAPNPFAQREASTFAALNANANAPRPTTRPSGPVYVPPGLSQSQRPTTAAQFTSPTTTPTVNQPTVPGPMTPARPPSLPTTYPGGLRRWVGEEMEQINNPAYTPNSATLALLEKMGLIKKTPPPPSSYAGGFKRGGGGGKRRAGKVPGNLTGNTQQGDRMPAFSTGAGFGGLVNWRL